MTAETGERDDASVIVAPPALDGIREGATVVAAYVPFALALGAALAATSVDPVTAWSSSPLIFGGAAQLVAVQLLDSGAALATVVLAALVVNSRHLLYSASIAPYARAWSGRSRGLAAYFMADPVYALAIGRFEGRAEDSRDRLRYYLAMALTCWVGWLALTWLGVVLGGALPSTLPLEMAAPLTFLLLTLPTLRNRAAYVAAAVGGAVAVPASQLPLGVGLVLATGAGIAAGVAAGRRHA